jgi:hypothetical protein
VEIIIAFVVFVLFFLAMAIGYMVKGRPLKGSCGGIANVMGQSSCEICGGSRLKCDEWQAQNATEVLSEMIAEKGDEKHQDKNQ